MATLVVPRFDGLTPNPSLGYWVCEFIEKRCVFGPGSLEGQQARLDDEKRGLIYSFYEIHPEDHPMGGNRVYDRCSVELRKGVAKTELAAWVTYAELHPEGPVRFNGWDDYGRPLRGRAVRGPYIPMLATAEEQVQELAFGVLKWIVEHSEDWHMFDSTLERIIRLGPSGTNDGMAVPVSNAPSTRDGARTSFQHFDEPHQITLPRQRAAVETMLENLHKRQLETPWALYTSTAGSPGQGSVQEDVRNEAELMNEGRAPDSSLFFFSRWASVDDHPDLSTVEKRVEAIKDATGPVGEWGKGQFLRIAKDYERVGVDRAFWERVWLNRWRKSSTGAYNVKKAKELALDEVIPRDGFVGLGFDGARRKDATAIVITEIFTGRQQLVAIWERPEDAKEWECPVGEVLDKMDEVFRYYEVWRAYCDPPYWVEQVSHWAGKWPDQVAEWWMNQQRKAAYMARAYGEAIDGGHLHVCGTADQRQDLLRHIGNTGRKELKINDDEGQPLWILQKQDGQEQNKIDACAAGNLSWQAKLDAVAAGARPRRGGLPRRLY